ncbi:MAG: DUF2442 domain-containing protein [Chloroflexota bacterium]|nr:DUF2442 domain-containing protein [Chloroflexota bacterium]
MTQVRYIREYRLELTFADGIRSEMDFRKKVVGRGGVFKPLEDLDFFRQVKVDPEGGTLIWPNDVDLDPDVLYSEATGTPIPAVETA